MLNERSKQGTQYASLYHIYENKIKPCDFFMDKAYVAKVKNIQENTHQLQAMG